MIASMTAFARDVAQGEWGRATWEIRSVNQRYLDLSFKMPDNFREWEQSWRHLVAKKLNRGKVDCYLSFQAIHGATNQYLLNRDLLGQLVHNCEEIMRYPGTSSQIVVTDLLRWPDVLIPEPKDVTDLKEPLTELLDSVLAKLVETRQGEGQAIASLLLGKITQVRHHVALARKQLPLCLQSQKQKLMARINDLSLTVDSQRLEQELVFYAQRMDIAEEMDRLDTHCNEIEKVIENGGPAGRRLDFLMQEMGREANTLSSKSLSGEVTKEAIELKVLIEQMREQIQNVE